MQKKMCMVKAIKNAIRKLFLHLHTDRVRIYTEDMDHPDYPLPREEERASALAYIKETESQIRLDHIDHEMLYLLNKLENGEVVTPEYMEAVEKEVIKLFRFYVRNYCEAFGGYIHYEDVIQDLVASIFSNDYTVWDIMHGGEVLYHAKCCRNMVSFYDTSDRLVICKPYQGEIMFSDGTMLFRVTQDRYLFAGHALYEFFPKEPIVWFSGGDHSIAYGKKHAYLLSDWYCLAQPREHDPATIYFNFSGEGTQFKMIPYDGEIQIKRLKKSAEEEKEEEIPIEDEV